MKIAILHHFYNEFLPSGENTAVLNQRDLLLRAGHEVELFSTHGATIESTVDKVRTGTSLLLGLGEDFSNEINSFKPDLVHVHNTFPLISIPSIEKIDCAKVMTIHNYRFLCAKGSMTRSGKHCDDCLRKSRWKAVKYKCYRGSRLATLPVISMQKKLITSDFFSQFEFIISVNRDIKERLYRSLMIESSQKVVTLRNFSSIPKIDTTKARNGKFLFVGRFEAEKGFDWLLRNWPNNYDLDLVGGGSLLSLYTNNKRRNINWLGMFSHARMMEVLPDYSGLVFPSNWMEGSPLVVIEALASGVPILTSSIPEISELIEEFQAGLVLKSESDLLENLAELKENKVYSENATRCFSENFSPELWLSKIEDLYAEALDSWTKKNSSL